MRGAPFLAVCNQKRGRHPITKPKKTMNKVSKVAMLGLALLPAALAADPDVTSYTGIVTGATTVWNAVQALIITVVTFGVCIAYVKRAKGR